MAKNQRGTAGRVHITAPATATPSGTLVYGNGFHGILVNDAAAGAANSVIDCNPTQYEIPLVATAAKGDIIYVALDGKTLSKTATNHRAVAIVCYTDTAPDAGRVVATGNMVVQLLPQTTVVPTA